jgi:hypothetical protein
MLVTAFAKYIMDWAYLFDRACNLILDYRRLCFLAYANDTTYRLRCPRLGVWIIGVLVLSKMNAALQNKEV